MGRDKIKIPWEELKKKKIERHEVRKRVNETREKNVRKREREKNKDRDAVSSMTLLFCFFFSSVQF